MSGRPWRHRLLRAALLAMGLYATLLAALWWGQERLLFHPHALSADHRFELPPDVHERWVDVPGARLHALHLQLPRPDGVVFYLHGNAGNLQGWFVDIGLYRRLNLDLYMLDYRGFGKSSGRIESEAQLMDDVRATWATLRSTYEGRRRVFLGQSLGSGLAAALAAEVQPELTVLVSPYFSVAALTRELYPWVPAALLRYPLRTDLALPHVHGRVLLVHGLDDRLIPPSHSAALRKLRPGTEWLPVPGGGHNDLQHHPAYLDGLAAALAR